MNFYPIGTRLVIGEKEKIFVIEQVPTVRTIKVNTAFGERTLDGEYCVGSVKNPEYKGGIKTYRIALPYCVFIVKNENVMMFFRNTPLSDANNILYNAALPNVSVNGVMCVGSIGYTTSWEKWTQIMLDGFWSTTFTSWFVKTYHPIKTFEEWERRTKEDSLFVLDIEWSQNCDLETAIERMKTYDPYD